MSSDGAVLPKVWMIVCSGPSYAGSHRSRRSGRTWVQELLWNARTVGSQNFRMLETLLLAALVYWVLTIIFSIFQERLEKRMARSDR